MMREMSDDFETWPGEVPALARGLCSPTRLHGSPRQTDMKNSWLRQCIAGTTQRLYQQWNNIKHGNGQSTNLVRGSSIATFDSRRVVGKCLWLGDFSLPGHQFPGATRNRRSDSGGDTEKEVWAKSYQRLTLWWSNIINHGNPPFLWVNQLNVHFQHLFVCLPKISTHTLANGFFGRPPIRQWMPSPSMFCVQQTWSCWIVGTWPHCKVILKWYTDHGI